MKLSNWSPKRFGADDVSNAEWGYQIVGSERQVAERKTTRHKDGSTTETVRYSPKVPGFVLFRYGPTKGGDVWMFVRDEVGQPITFPTWGTMIAHVVETVTREGPPMVRAEF